MIHFFTESIQSVPTDTTFTPCVCVCLCNLRVNVNVSEFEWSSESVNGAVEWADDAMSEATIL